MKSYFIEFKYDDSGHGILTLRNDSLIVFSIHASTGRFDNGLKKAIKPGRYQVIDATKNVVKLEGAKKIATGVNDVSVRIHQVLRKQDNLYCNVNIPEDEEIKKENRFFKWIKIVSNWIERR